ncbi:MAG: HEAT repeat domain-containing protein [Planctomycetota bacterium]
MTRIFLTLSYVGLLCCLGVSAEHAVGDDAVANSVDRYAEIDQLGYATDDVAAAVTTLEALLASNETAIQWRAARALGHLGSPAASAAPALVDLLAHEDPVVQVHASIALARIGDKSPSTLNALLAEVTEEDERIARTAIQTLRHLQVPPEKLAAALESVLQSDNAAVMLHAVDAMVAYGGKATPFLNAALAKEKSAYWAALAIGEIGPDAAGTVPALIDLLGRSEDPETTQLALIAVAKIGPAAFEASPTVQEIAKATEESAIRIAACYAMGAIGADSATPLLRELETTGDEFQAMACAWSLAKLHPDDPDAADHAVESLVAGLMSEREAMRNAAAAGLRELDVPAGTVSEALIAAVKDATPEQRSHIALALASLGPEVTTYAVRALADPTLRDVAIEVLGRLGADAVDGVDSLSELLQQESDELVARAQYALASIGIEAGEATESLAQNLEHKSEEVRQSALFALRQIGAGAQQAAEPLHEFLETTEDQFEQFATAWTLAKLKLDAHLLEEVTETLSEALESDDEQVRLETIAAIRDLSQAGDAFDAKLKDLAENDPSPEVRAAAAAAVQ